MEPVHTQTYHYPSRPVRRQPSNLIHHTSAASESFVAPPRTSSARQLLQQPIFLEPRSFQPSRTASPASIITSTVPSADTSGRSSYRESVSSCYTTDFDSLYDVSDEDDSALVPLKCSNSVKQLLSRVPHRRGSLPSLVIPSPTAWPTIQKLQKAQALPPVPPIPAKMPLSPAALAKLTVHTLKVPTANSTPSLDGSLTSDEIASMSPSTPDLRSKSNDAADQWDMPVQLDPQAMDVLNHLACDFAASELGPIIEVPEAQANEMQERGLNINLITPQPALEIPASEPVSAISVPSPGGFLSSLNQDSQSVWNVLSREQGPSTSTAENFYGVPWQSGSTQSVEHVIEYDKDDGTDGPPTAKQQNFTVQVTSEPAEPAEAMVASPEVYEYDEQYEQKLHETASSNMSRTSMWLYAQESYLSALKSSNPLNSEEPSPPTRYPSTPDSSSMRSPSAASVLSPKKAVRFVEPSAKTPLTAIHAPVHGKTEPLFYHAFQHLNLNSRPSDAFSLRHLRADALQAQRLYMQPTHIAQLTGNYAIAIPKRPTKDFAHLPTAPNDPAVQRHREAVARADRERQALQQISLAHWHLDATRLLTGGTLLPKAARASLDAATSSHRTPRILDLGGLPTADWGWAVALEHRDAKVYTAVVAPPSSPTDRATEWPTHRSPSNHRTLTITRPWRLPFPTGSFDVVSARTLHALCRTTKPDPHITSPGALSPPTTDFAFPFAGDFALPASGPGLAFSTALDAAHDEYAATLAECHRVLAPGGTLHYTLVDADVHAPATTSPLNAPCLSALAARFAATLREHAYDPAPLASSQSRVAAAGFAPSSIRETPLSLAVAPARGATYAVHGCGKDVVAGGSTVAGGDGDAGAVTELLGAVAWERWVLAVQGAEGLRGFGRAVEEARRDGRGAAFRMAVGVATK